MTDIGEWNDRVRAGYDLASYAYRCEDAPAGVYAMWAERLLGQLASSSAVVDLGCGVPMARDLTAAGHRVTGVDMSEVQIERARRLVPAARFVVADIAAVSFDDCSFGAAVFLYSIIHLPLERQPVVLERVAGWLRPGGLLVLSAGLDAWTGSETNWLGTRATMWWSQTDAATYRRWIQESGLVILDEQIVPDGNSAHALFWAQRPHSHSSG